MILPFFLFALTILSMFTLRGIEQVQSWDEAALLYFASWRTPGWNLFFRYFTETAGTAMFLVALFIPAILWFRRKRPGLALYYLAGVSLLKLSVSGWKHLIARPRPLGGLVTVDTFAMPSGHSANAVFIFGVLGIVLLRKIKSSSLRHAAFILCMLWMFAIGLSRVYLGVHYPTDVLVGLLYTASGLWILQSFRKDIFDF